MELPASDIIEHVTFPSVPCEAESLMRTSRMLLAVFQVPLTNHPSPGRVTVPTEDPAASQFTVAGEETVTHEELFA